MSLGVVVKGTDGIVLAADTRISLSALGPSQEVPLQINFDNATKLLSFGNPHKWVGAVTYGVATIENRTAHSLIPELEPTLGEKRLTVVEYAKKISDFFLQRWKDSNMPSSVPANGGMTFIVGGFGEGEPYGEVFLFNIPRSPCPVPRNEGTNFGISWGGQLEIASRIIQGYDPRLLQFVQDELGIPNETMEEFRQKIRGRLEFRIPYAALPLQDCIDLATFLIRTTITGQNLAIANRGVGGSIEVAAITRTEGLNWVQKKGLHGET